jgi:hypothetical protein
MITSLSWTIIEGNKSKGSNVAAPDWSNVEAVLEPILAARGSLTLHWLDQNGVMSKNLQIQANNGAFLISLGVDDGEKYEVRSFFKHCEDSTQVEFFGELWSESSVCRDSAVPRKAMNQFYFRGDVEKGILSD